MNRLNTERRSPIIRSLCEGNSIRGTARLCDCAINTVVKLLLEVGPACAAYQDEHVRNLNSLVVHCDEIWSFVGKKMKRTTADDRSIGKGDAWTWTAIDADSKLMITWLVGLRNESDCGDFIDDLASRLNNRIRLSTDGFGSYGNAVKLAFGPNVDRGVVEKMYRENQEYVGHYSPAVCTSCHTKALVGDPIDSLIPISHVERQNLYIRMGCRRFTHLTNAFSKKLQNHMAAFSLYAFFYNFCRPHQTLTKQSGSIGKNSIATTPAMATYFTDHVWTVAEMIETVLATSN